jgi:methionyl-tRNA formyltransferase
MKHHGRETNKRVAVVGCKHTTLELIVGLEQRGFTVDHCITLSPEQGAHHKVAGYTDLRPFLEGRALPYSVVKQYSLNSPEDRNAMPALELDALLVMGWQRLIPAWFLERLSIGAFGMHGSSKPLPHGRGRSPMNWSLIQNKECFYTHLFRYRPGVDDGEIAAVQVFDITPFDTCLTLHYKNTLSMIGLLERSLPALLEGTAKLTPQPTEGATYYPKRAEEDGLIYWTDTMIEIYNLVRAVTRPFPGAFSFLDNQAEKKVRIWRAIPFDTRLDWPNAVPGQVVAVFGEGAFVVRTGEASLLVQESEGAPLTHSDVGRRFGDLGTPRKIWPDLPE